MAAEAPEDIGPGRSGLAGVAFERLRANLLAGGELTAGRRLVAEDLARRLGMSRTPVREALHQLARLGYLSPHEGGGYERRRYQARDLRDLFELRLLLEPHAAALAAAGRPAVPEAAPGFHLAVAEACGNRVLAHVIDLVTERMAAAGVTATGSAENGPGPAGTDEATEAGDLAARMAHARIARAIREGDAARAGNEMAAHIAAHMDRLLPPAQAWPMPDPDGLREVP